jgi:hypothetical protein
MLENQNREQITKNREQRTENKEQRTKNKEQIELINPGGKS